MNESRCAGNPAALTWRSWVFEMARADGARLLLATVLSALAATANAATTWLMVPLASVLFPTGSTTNAEHASEIPLSLSRLGEWAGDLFRGASPTSVAFLLVLVFVIKNLCEFGSRTGGDALAAASERGLRNSLWRRYLSFSRVSDRTFSGERLVHEMTGGACDAAGLIGSIPSRWIGDPLAAIALLATMAFVNPLLTICLVCVLPAGWWAIRKSFGSVGDHAQGRLAARARLGARLSELARFGPVLAGHGAREWGCKDAERREETLSKATISWSRSVRLVPVAAETLGAVAGAIVVVLVAEEIRDGSLSGGEFLTFLTAFFLLLPVLKRLAALSGELRTSRAAWARLAALIPADERTRTSLPQVRMSRPPGISLVGIRARGPEGAVLDVPHTEFPAGALTVIVGATGAGKSCLLEIIAGLAAPDAGEVRWNGITINSHDLFCEGVTFGYVPQSRWTVSGSVAENIALGRPVAEHRMVELLRQLALPLDLELRLGQDGAPLSGGERQRMALARALALEPPLLLLDEPTSALDLRTELRVVDMLVSLRGKATMLIASHRPALLSAADHVLDLNLRMELIAGEEVTTK